MQKQSMDYTYYLKALYDILPLFIGGCFTDGAVTYMQEVLQMAMESDDFYMEPMIFQHMYDRFSLVVPHFTEAWDALEKCNTPDEAVEVGREYETSAWLAAMVITARNRSFDWREEYPTPVE